MNLKTMICLQLFCLQNEGNMCLMKYSLQIIHQSQTVVSVKIKDLWAYQAFNKIHQACYIVFFFGHGISASENIFMNLKDLHTLCLLSELTII